MGDWKLTVQDIFGTVWACVCFVPLVLLYILLVDVYKRYLLDRHQQSNKLKASVQKWTTADLVLVTCSLLMVRQILEVLSWIYWCVTLKWDDSQKALDAAIYVAEAFTTASLQLTFIRRLDETLRQSSHGYSSGTFAALFTMLVIYCVDMLAMSYAQYRHRFILLAVTGSVALLLLVVQTVIVTYLFSKPLTEIAKSTGQGDHLLDMNLRLSLVAMIGLGITSFTYIWRVVAYCICVECTITYAYFAIYSVEAIVTCFCLLCMLKRGEPYYRKVLGRVHVILAHMAYPEKDILAITGAGRVASATMRSITQAQVEATVGQRKLSPMPVRGSMVEDATAFQFEAGAHRPPLSFVD